MFYQNKNYHVIIKDGKYVVTNNDTGIAEFDSPLLPEALNAAFALDSRLNQFWEQESKSHTDRDEIPIKSIN